MICRKIIRDIFFDTYYQDFFSCREIKGGRLQLANILILLKRSLKFGRELDYDKVVEPLKDKKLN